MSGIFDSSRSKVDDGAVHHHEIMRESVGSQGLFTDDMGVQKQASPECVAATTSEHSV